MKAKLYIILGFIFLFTAGETQAQIPNSGFESWTLDVDNNLNPDSWETSNAYPLVSVEQYTPAYAGNYSLRASAFDAGIITIAGIAYVSFPLTARPTHLRACVKTNVMPGDFAYIMFAAWSGDSVIAAADSCTFKIDSAITQFTCINLPIAYISSLLPDSATIMISGGDLSNAQLGTEIIVDELSFLGVGIDEAEKGISFQSYPNPASDRMNFTWTMKQREDLTLHIYDSNGKEVITENVQAALHSVSIPVSNLAEGLYFSRLTGENINTSGKFLIVR